MPQREDVASGVSQEYVERNTRLRLDEGARLSDYYPLSSSSRLEYEEWRRQQGRKH